MGKRAQRIPSWPRVIHSNEGRIHLRRQTCDILTFRLRPSGGPYIPDSPSLGKGESSQCVSHVAEAGAAKLTITVKRLPDSVLANRPGLHDRDEISFRMPEKLDIFQLVAVE